MLGHNPLLVRTYQNSRRAGLETNQHMPAPGGLLPSILVIAPEFFSREMPITIRVKSLESLTVANTHPCNAMEDFWNVFML